MYLAQRVSCCLGGAVSCVYPSHKASGRK